MVSVFNNKTMCSPSEYIAPLIDRRMCLVPVELPQPFVEIPQPLKPETLPEVNMFGPIGRIAGWFLSKVKQRKEKKLPYLLLISINLIRF